LNTDAIGLAVAYASAIRTDVSVHGGTSPPTNAASVRPRSAADYLIQSAVDISFARHKGNTRVGMPAASDLVRSDIINGLGAGARADNVVASTLANDAVNRHYNCGRNLGDVGSHFHASLSDAAHVPLIEDVW